MTGPLLWLQTTILMALVNVLLALLMDLDILIGKIGFKKYILTSCTCVCSLDLENFFSKCSGPTLHKEDLKIKDSAYFFSSQELRNTPLEHPKCSPILMEEFIF